MIGAGGAVERVVLSDGSDLEADLVLVGIGSRPPPTGWRVLTSMSITGSSAMASAVGSAPNVGTR